MTLRAVGPDEKLPVEQVVHDNITDALNGSARDVLASMRRALAIKLDDGEVASNSIASAYKELREIDKQIRLLDAESEDRSRSNGEGSERRTFKPEAI